MYIVAYNRFFVFRVYCSKLNPISIAILGGIHENDQPALFSEDRGIGGNSNSTTGDTSIGIVGQLFEKGVPVQAVSEMNIADNHLNLWTRLVEAGNDPYPYSNAKYPSLVFRDVVVSGI